jgi:uncharacterized membrane protein
MREKQGFSLPGGAMLFLILVAMGATVLFLISSIQLQAGPASVFCALAIVAEVIMLGGSADRESE